MSGWKLVYHVPSSQAHPGSRGRQAGAIHLHAVEDADLGRIKVKAGQALCRRRAWYPRPVDEHDLRTAKPCGRCSDRAQRYGVEWPEGSDEGVDGRG